MSNATYNFHCVLLSLFLFVRSACAFALNVLEFISRGQKVKGWIFSTPSKHVSPEKILLMIMAREPYGDIDGLMGTHG
jgi:hypothetical protein